MEKKWSSRIGLACVLLKLLTVVIHLVHAVIQLAGPTINYRAGYYGADL